MTASLKEVLAAFLDETNGDASIEGNMIVLPTVDGWSVVAGLNKGRGHWIARRIKDAEVVELEDGPAADDAEVPEVVDYLRRVCNAEPDDNVRSYVIGLPVIITVNPDGSVEAGIDLSEADDLDDDSGGRPDDLTDGQLLTDMRRVREAVEANAVEVSRG